MAEPDTAQQRPAWVNDIAIHTTKVLTTTGGTVWDAARRAAKYLEAMQQQIGIQQPGVKVRAHSLLLMRCTAHGVNAAHGLVMQYTSPPDTAAAVPSHCNPGPSTGIPGTVVSLAASKIL